MQQRSAEPGRPQPPRHRGQAGPVRGAVRRIIERGHRSGRFQTRTPDLAAFAVLEMGNGTKSWFRPSGRYPDTHVAREYGEFALRIVGCTG